MPVLLGRMWERQLEYEQPSWVMRWKPPVEDDRATR